LGRAPRANGGARIREQLKTQANGGRTGLTVGPGFTAPARPGGQAKMYEHAYAYLHERRRWMRYQAYRRQHLPIGSGITEAVCKIVFTQRLKRSGMAWTKEGGQVILDLRVIWLSGVWDAVHQRYLASQPLPAISVKMAQGAPHEQLAA